MKKLFTLFCLVIASHSLLFSSDLTVTGSFPENIWVNNAVDYSMSQIGTTNVYSLEKYLTAGTYEFKVFYTGTFNGANGSPNAQITLTTDKTVKFYAKDNGTTISFMCDAQELYVIGDIVGGWDTSNATLMTSATAEANYTASVLAGDYKIVSKNGTNLVWDYITPSNQNIGLAGSYNIKFDFASFSLSVTNDVSTWLINNKQNSSVYVEDGVLKAHFVGSADVELYALTGRLITKVNANNDFYYPVNQGVYLLTINGDRFKVLAR